MTVNVTILCLTSQGTNPKEEEAKQLQTFNTLQIKWL